MLLIQGLSKVLKYGGQAVIFPLMGKVLLLFLCSCTLIWSRRSCSTACTVRKVLLLLLRLLSSIFMINAQGAQSGFLCYQRYGNRHIDLLSPLSVEKYLDRHVVSRWIWFFKNKSHIDHKNYIKQDKSSLSIQFPNESQNFRWLWRVRLTVEPRVRYLSRYLVAYPNALSM